MKITTFNNLDEITGNEGKILLYDEAKSKIGASTETVNEIIQDQVGSEISRLDGRVDTVESNLTSNVEVLNSAIALKADADKVYTKLDTSAIQFVSTSAEAVTGTQGVIYIVTGTNA